MAKFIWIACFLVYNRNHAKIAIIEHKQQIDKTHPTVVINSSRLKLTGEICKSAFKLNRTAKVVMWEQYWIRVPLTLSNE